MNTEVPMNTTGIYCNLCFGYFINRKTFSSHLESKLLPNENNLYNCIYCTFTDVNKFICISHINNEHFNNKTKFKLKGQCKNCKKNFNDLKSYKNHIDNKLCILYIHKCKRCNELFSTKKSKVNHENEFCTKRTKTIISEYIEYEFLKDIFNIIDEKETLEIMKLLDKD